MTCPYYRGQGNPVRYIDCTQHKKPGKLVNDLSENLRWQRVYCKGKYHYCPDYQKGGNQ